MRFLCRARRLLMLCYRKARQSVLHGAANTRALLGRQRHAPSHFSRLISLYLQNSLEFELRRQEFIELLRLGRLAEAITYAQKNISIHRESQQRKVDQVCALLCYHPGTEIEPYKVILSVTGFTSTDHVVSICGGKVGVSRRTFPRRASYIVQYSKQSAS